METRALCPADLPTDGQGRKNAANAFMVPASRPGEPLELRLTHLAPRRTVSNGSNYSDDDFSNMGFEGSIKSMPRLGRSRPSDRATKRRALERRLEEAQEKAAAESARPLIHGRYAISGIVFLELIRTAAWYQGTVPGYSVFGMHFLTTASDVACILCALPLFATGTQGQCVMLGCLGPMLTLVFAMSLVDMSALAAYLVVAMPRPLAPGAKTYVDVLEACIGVWEFALVASVALQLALCASCWRVYKELRTTGLYPPGSDPASIGMTKEISVMEIMCEAEDVELLADCEMSCESGLKSPLLVCGVCASGPSGALAGVESGSGEAAGGGGTTTSTAGGEPRESSSEVILEKVPNALYEESLEDQPRPQDPARCDDAAAAALGPRSASETLPGVASANARMHPLGRNQLAREQTN
jgi:hypothetical protein